jgi:hypothetical protein
MAMSDEVIDATAEEEAPELEGEPPALEVQEEMVDGVPVLAEIRPVDRSPSAIPAVQAAAAAATGFVAGAATIALVRRLHARRLAQSQGVVPRARGAIGRPGRNGAMEMLPIVGTRTFLVDVHVIAKPGD